MTAQLGGGVVRDEKGLCIGPVWREGRELTFPLPNTTPRSKLARYHADRIGAFPGRRAELKIRAPYLLEIFEAAHSEPNSRFTTG